MHKRLKHIFPYILTIIGLSFPQKSKAQGISGSFIMSSVGSIQNSANNSMAVTFSSNTNCLNIQNGTAVLTGERGTGSFAINCEVKSLFNTLGIKLYPNPVSENTKVKFINQPPFNDKFSITVWSNQGGKISASHASGYEIYQGKIMHFSTLVAGSYIIQIESDKYRDALKFIKAN